MLRISKEFVTDNCSPKNPPVARCQSGDTVMFETRDCYDDRLCGDGTVIEPEKALENPATGPSNGTPAFIKAEDAAIIATISGRKFGSIDSTVVTTCTSWR